MWIAFGQYGMKYTIVPLHPPDAQSDTKLRGHRLNDRLFRITASALFDPIYRGRVRPVDMLDISERYSYDTFNDLIDANQI